MFKTGVVAMSLYIDFQNTLMESGFNAKDKASLEMV